LDEAVLGRRRVDEGGRGEGSGEGREEGKGVKEEEEGSS